MESLDIPPSAAPWSPGALIDQGIHFLNGLAPADSYFHSETTVRGLLALVLASLCCGAVGSLVVGGRMAFFSDALAHCAFAGVSVGFLIFEGIVTQFRPASEFWDWVTPVMVGFGLLVGAGIALVRERTELSNDTVIGIFFAGAIGLAAMLRKVIQDRRLFDLEGFLFGDPITIRSSDLFLLLLLLLLTLGVLWAIYNPLLLTSVNRSLALSRRVPTRLVNLAFVLLLAVIVNVCLRCVGALLINALLVVPAATAMNLSRNLRQVFWWTVGLCVALSVGGEWLSWETEALTGKPIGTPGTVILLAVVLFVLSAVLGKALFRGTAQASGGR
jgi:zinc transport system permease protein